jgi:hypothetical protein
MTRYLDSKHLKLCTHIEISIFLYRSSSVTTREHSEPLPQEKYGRIVAPFRAMIDALS